MSLLGLMCFLLAGLDLTTSLLGASFTSVSWSPLVFMLLGALFFALESLQQSDRRQVWALVALLLGASLLAGCAGGTRAPACAPETASATPEDAATGYRLGSQDRVQVTVFRQPEMSGEFALDGEGYLALPLAGEIKAGGLTSRELENQIEERLRAEGFLVNPQVGVQVLTFRSFYILGEVNQPGSYEYRDGMTVINAVALAGGFSYRAAQDSITIERKDCSMPTQPDTAVLPGDILQVPERFF